MKKDIPFIMILGRSGAGKDTYAKVLKDNGYTGVLSYATRPKRAYDEATHIFISPEEAEKYDDKVAVTQINGYEYFATREQVNTSNYYIIDPNGVRELLSNYKGLDYIIVYLYCDKDIRKERAIKRAVDTDKEIAIFNSRNNSENGQFTEFEQNIYQYKNVIIHNTSNIDIYDLERLVRHDMSLFEASQNDFVDTNMGRIPHEDYLEIMAQQAGFESAQAMREAGYIIK